MPEWCKSRNGHKLFSQGRDLCWFCVSVVGNEGAPKMKPPLFRLSTSLPQGCASTPQSNLIYMATGMHHIITSHSAPPCALKMLFFVCGACACDAIANSLPVAGDTTSRIHRDFRRFSVSVVGNHGPPKMKPPVMCRNASTTARTQPADRGPHPRRGSLPVSRHFCSP